MGPMTLGELISALSRKDRTSPVFFDFVHFRPSGLDSYRGYYDQLAIGYDHDGVNVGDLLDLCKDAVGKTFQGYKGGDFTMDESTPIWVANYGEAGSTAVVDVVDEEWQVILKTAHIRS